MPTKSTKTKLDFFFHVTDTFGNELNYCWLHRYKIKSKSIKGALIKLSKYTGLNFKNNGVYYKAKHACIAAYLVDYEIHESEYSKYKEI
jgi:hypothetical protein